LFPPPQDITKSHVYFSSSPAREDFCRRYGIPFPTAGWIEQEVISRALFGENGVTTVQRTTASFGVFLWAPEFSNVHDRFSFTEVPIEVGGEVFSCTEAYYQAMKSDGCFDHQRAVQIIRGCDPWEAYSFGRQFSLREDWDTARVDVMRKALQAKFTQHASLRQLLLLTNPYPLVQVKGDRFWGSGFDGSGENMLGVLLQELRSVLLLGT